LLDQQLKLPSQSGASPDPSLTRRAYTVGPDAQRLRIVEREIRPAGPGSAPYSYAVAGDSAEIDRDLAAFTTMLIAALAVLGLGLVAATFFQVRFGLQPLRVIRQDLSAIRSGEAEQLEGQLDAWLEDPDPLLRETARQAKLKLGETRGSTGAGG